MELTIHGVEASEAIDGGQVVIGSARGDGRVVKRWDSNKSTNNAPGKLRSWRNGKRSRPEYAPTLSSIAEIEEKHQLESITIGTESLLNCSHIVVAR